MVYMYGRGATVLSVVLCNGKHVSERYYCIVCRDLLLVYMYQRGVTVLFAVICLWYTYIGEELLYCLS